MIARLLAPLALLLSACATTTAAQSPTVASPANQAPGAVSSADPRASAAGAEMLSAGGTATDAAAAVMLALTVVEPQSSGIGGGGFIVSHDAASGRITTYNGRERAPMAATPAYFLDANGQPRTRDDAIPGGMSVGVPGSLRLIEAAHRAHGRLPWAQLFQPAIRLARDGYQITPRLFASLRAQLERPGGPDEDRYARSIFYGPDGQPLPVGTTVRNPELAAFLERVAATGPDYLYTGPGARALIASVTGAARNPSTMTLGDLAAYDVQERPAQCGTYRGYRICGMGPPSSGATTVFAILRQLERFDLAGLGPNDPRAWHLIAESSRLAYADREAFIGDPDFVSVPTAGLMSNAYLDERSRLIRLDGRMASVAHGNPPGAQPRTLAPPPNVPSTSHFSTADRMGNVVSYTSTIEGAFGSGLTSNGFFLNNELTDFSFVPEQDGAPVANRVEPGKRPMSAMSPTIVYDPQGRVRLVVGAAGGPTIIAQVAKAIIGVIDWRMSAQEAIAAPFIMGRGNQVLVERGTALEQMVPQLRAMGHEVVVTGVGLKANAVEFVNGHWVGAADPRSEGASAGEHTP